ncbi:MAG: PEGA domain-containing protein [Bacillota bacterium]
MSDYHYKKKDETNLEETIRLDLINQQMRELESDIDNELGDEDEYLEAFSSEQLGKIKRKVKRQKTEYADEYEKETDGEWLTKKNITLFSLLAVVLVIAGFFVTSTFMKDEEEPLSLGTEDVQAEETQEIFYRSMLLQDIWGEDQLVAYDIESKTPVAMTLIETTSIIDDFNNEVDFSYFHEGEIIMVGRNDNREVVFVSPHKDVIKYESVNVEVDPKSERILVVEPNEMFRYHEETLLIYEGEELPLDSLQAVDVVTLTTLYGDVFYIKMEQTHGELLIAQEEEIKNGRLLIDGTTEYLLDHLTPLPPIILSEGEHTIEISGDLIKDKMDTIEILPMESLTYDLSELEDKTGKFAITSNVTDYEFYVNDELISDPLTAEFPYGDYRIKVLKSGYVDFSTAVALDIDIKTLNLELEEAILFGTVVLTSDVGTGQVYVDDVAMGKVPCEINLPYGTYHIRVEEVTYSPFATEITVSEDYIYVKAQLMTTDENRRQEE